MFFTLEFLRREYSLFRHDIALYGILQKEFQYLLGISIYVPVYGHYKIPACLREEVKELVSYQKAPRDPPKK